MADSKGRGRIIHRDLFADPLMSEFSDSVLLVFIGLWTLCDDSGVLLDEPTLIVNQLVRRNTLVASVIDTLVATDRVWRGLAPDGQRVLVIKNFQRHNEKGVQWPSRPRICYRWELSHVPTPSRIQRAFLKTKYDVTDWDHPVVAECAKCGKPGQLRFATPESGAGSESAAWLGSVVASRVEIVPTGVEPEDVELLCRECRTDVVYTGPTGVPAPDWTDGDYPDKREVKPAKHPLLIAQWIADHNWSPPGREDGLPYDEITKGPMAPARKEAKVVTFRGGASPTPDRARPAVAKGSAPATEVEPDVQEVFDAWRATVDTDSEVHLDSRRKRAIVVALKDYPKKDVLDAVVGWKNIPFNLGDNRDGQVISEITSLLKSSSDIERYRDAARSGPRSVRSGRRRAGANVTHFDGEAAVDDFRS